MEKYYSPVYETNHSLQLKNAIKGEKTLTLIKFGNLKYL